MRIRTPRLRGSFPPSSSAVWLVLCSAPIFTRSHRPTFGTVLEVTSDAESTVSSNGYDPKSDKPDRPEGYSVVDDGYEAEEETGKSAAAAVSPGDPKCPCIAVGNKSADPTAQVNNLTLNGKIAAYPTITATCQAWDDGRYPASCEETSQVPGKGRGFCVLPFCYVDPCNCQAKFKPQRSSGGLLVKGYPAFFSYSTCGVEAVPNLSHLTDGCNYRPTADKCKEDKYCEWSKEGKCVDVPPEMCNSDEGTKASASRPTTRPSSTPKSTSPSSATTSLAPSSKGCHVKAKKGCPKSSDINSDWRTLDVGVDQDGCKKGWLNFQATCGSKEVVGMFVDPPLQVYLYDANSSAEEDMVSEPGCYWRTAAGCTSGGAALETNAELQVARGPQKWDIKYREQKETSKALSPSEEGMDKLEEGVEKLVENAANLPDGSKATAATATGAVPDAEMAAKPAPQDAETEWGTWKHAEGTGANAAECQDKAYNLIKETSCSVQTLYVPEHGAKAPAKAPANSGATADADGLTAAEHKALATIRFSEDLKRNAAKLVEEAKKKAMEARVNMEEARKKATEAMRNQAEAEAKARQAGVDYHDSGQITGKMTGAVQYADARKQSDKMSPPIAPLAPKSEGSENTPEEYDGESVENDVEAQEAAKQPQASTDTCPDFVFSGYCASNHTLNCYDTAGGPPTGQIPQCGVNDAYTCPSGMKKCHKVVVQASTDTCPDFVFSGYCASHHTLNCYDPAGGPPTGQIPQCGVNDAYNCPHGMKKCHKANGSAEDINEVAEDVEGSDGAEDDQIPDDMDNVEGQNVDKDKGVADVIKGMTQTLKTDIGAEGMPAVGPLPVAGPPSAAGPAEDVDMDKLGGIDDMIKGMTQALKKPPTIAMGPKGQEQLFTGHTDCPCVTSDDVDPDRTGSGALEEVKVEGRKAKYPVLRAQCDAWDNGRYPGKCEDTGQSPGKDQGFCKLKWCYVDACNCKLAIPPSKSAYKAEGTYKGRPLYFSYATCGNAPEVGTAVSEAQCEMQSNKETCDMIKDCAWTGLNCMRQDLVDLCMREGVNVSSSDEDGDSDIGNILDHVKAATTPGSKGISSGDQGIPASPLNGDLQERREDTRQQKRSPVIVLSSLPGVAVNTPGGRA